MRPEFRATAETGSVRDESFTDYGRHPGLSSRRRPFGGRHKVGDTDVATRRVDQGLGTQFSLQIQVHGQGRGVRI